MTLEAATAARGVIDAADASYRRLGHENLGFLSERHGFMPREPPLLALPPGFAPWDAAAAALPDLYRTCSVRDAIDALPVIDAVALDDRHLLRASTILSILAHAYHRAGPGEAPQLPAALALPWEEVSRRLGRPSPVLSYIDLIVYNWRLARDGPLLVENLALLVPTVDNAEERVFYLTQVEILSRATPIVGAVVRAQEAVARGDRDRLVEELSAIADRLNDISARSLPKIDPNPLSRFAVDPVVWAKTVAPFAVPIVPGAQGPSGTSSPIFHLLDAFFGRTEHASVLGTEMVRLRAWYPRHWRELVDAVGAISVADHVAALGDRRLEALYLDALAAYAGEQGYLARHRLKVYGYLELAFKVGRTLTIGGFAGVFQDRTWDEVDDELERARAERHADSAHFHELRVLPAASADAAGTVNHVRLDTAGTGVRFHPGDRCAVLPRNRAELVEQTLRALGARGDETVPLDRAWRRATGGRTELPLRSLVELGRIRPVARDVATAMAFMTHNETLERIVEAREEDQWELWDLLELLRDTGFDPRVLWQAGPVDPESICRIVPPESPRHYSVASADDGTGLELAVGLLRYETASAAAGSRARTGTASGFLPDATTVPARVIPAMRFRPPDDHRLAIVMFAGGSGIAPFRSFLRARARHPDAGENWLFVGARTRAEIPFQDELEQLAWDGRLQVRFALSRGQPEPRRIGDVIGAERDELRRLLGAEGGSAYVCGRAGFAKAVTGALTEVVGDLAQLAADGRFVREVFTTYTRPHHRAPASFDASEIALHNDERRGLWMVLDGRVYDVTAFQALHPGGTKSLRGYVGMDATAVYRSVGHAADPGVGSLRALYEIGVVRRLDLGAAWGVWVGDSGLQLIRVPQLYRRWVRALYLAVEMQNAHRNDLSIHDRPTIRGEQPHEVSPFKAELLAEIHPRFVANCVRGLEEALRELWGPTSGACSPTEDVRWMERRLEAMRQGADARRSSQAVNARDAELLREMKDILRAGVQLFERYERDVLRVAADRLLETTRDLAECLERWYADTPEPM
jgi:sulfite reductase alpha subunit-like flavoprotein